MSLLFWRLNKCVESLINGLQTRQMVSSRIFFLLDPLEAIQIGFMETHCTSRELGKINSASLRRKTETFTFSMTPQCLCRSWGALNANTFSVLMVSRSLSSHFNEALISSAVSQCTSIFPTRTMVWIILLRKWHQPLVLWIITLRHVELNLMISQFQSLRSLLGLRLQRLCTIKLVWRSMKKALKLLQLPFVKDTAILLIGTVLWLIIPFFSWLEKTQRVPFCLLVKSSILPNLLNRVKIRFNGLCLGCYGSSFMFAFRKLVLSLIRFILLVTLVHWTDMWYVHEDLVQAWSVRFDFFLRIYVYYFIIKTFL